jgi:hypothetical protein
MDLLLHIGCEKTGTTSVQFWLDSHAGRLMQRGIVYSRVLGRRNNRRISLYGLEPGTPDDQWRLEGVTNPAQHARMHKDVERELAEEVRTARQTGCTTFVISNEHLHSRQKTDVNVSRVHALLQPLFDRVRVVCFLRPQLDTCLSRASTLSRNGHSISRDWIERDLDPTNFYYQYDTLLARWAKPFGASAIVPVAYARVPDAIGYFEQQLGVADLALQRPKTENPAIDYRVMAIVNGMNQNATKLNVDGDFRMRRWFVNELPVEQRLTMDRSLGQSLQARFEPINKAVCAAWPTIRMADLVPDWSKYPEHGNLDRVDMANEIGPFLRRMLDRKHLEVAMEKARRLSMTCDREIAQGRPKAALAACHEGIALAEEAVKVESYRVLMEQVIIRLRHRVAKLETTLAAETNSV